MNNSKVFRTQHLSTRLTDRQYQYIKAKDNPSEYVRGLIECDLRQVVQDEQS
jgi:hypothetical protein